MSLRLYKVFDCKKCFFERNNKLFYNRDFFDKFIMDEQLELLEDPGPEVNGSKEISVKCKTQGCQRYICRTIEKLHRNKNFICDLCKIRNKDQYEHIPYDNELYYDYLADYRFMTVGINNNIHANKLIVGKCNREFCDNFFFKPFNKCYHHKLPYCDECSYEIKCDRKNKNKYSKDIVEEIFCLHNIKNYNIYNKEETFNLNSILEFKCGNPSCKQNCSREVKCFVETENIYCHECSLSDIEIINYDKNLFLSLIPILYHNINFEIPDEIDKDTIFSYKCLNKECDEHIIKNFENLLYRQENFCKDHLNDETYYDNWLRLFVAKNNIILNQEYKKLRSTDRIKGKCLTPECDKEFNKTICNLTKTELPYCIECTNRIGFQRIMDSNLATKNVKYNLADPALQKQIRETVMKKYGVTNVSLVPEIKKRQEETMLARYGFRHAIQVPEFFEKQQKSGFQRKKYTAPKGKIFVYMGYEHHALDILLKEQNYDEEQLFTAIKEVPKIVYELKDKIHRYFTDIYIPNENRCIEVKSWHYYKKDYEKNWAKHFATIDCGFSHEFWIINTKGKLVKTITEKEEQEPKTINEIIVKLEDTVIDVPKKKKKLRLRKVANNIEEKEPIVNEEITVPSFNYPAIRRKRKVNN